MIYYKDSYDMNHRSAIPAKLKEFADIICQKNYDEILLPHPRKQYCHDKDHKQCEMIMKNVDRVTEKRICRCWYYYNQGVHSIKCKGCRFQNKKKNMGEIKILDYEIPTCFSMKNLGRIDWLLDDHGESLAAEVKYQNSKETIVRMMAEILTYTIGTSYIPAICFFKTEKNGNHMSKQCLDYLTYKDNPNFVTIKNKTGLKVLYITFDKESFEIHDIEKEPIV